MPVKGEIMAVKRFCDICEKEISKSLTTNRIQARVKLMQKRVGIEIMCGTGDKWNDGDICATCLYDAVHEAFEACGYEV